MAVTLPAVTLMVLVDFAWADGYFQFGCQAARGHGDGAGPRLEGNDFACNSVDAHDRRVA